MKQNIILKTINSKHSKRFKDSLNNDHYNDDRYKEYSNSNINESTFNESDVQMSVRLFTSFSVLSTDKEKDTVNLNDSALQKAMMSS